MSVRPLLTVKQVCQRLTIGRTTLEGLFKSGKLTKVVIGPKAIRVDPDELDRFVASVSQVGTSVESAVAVRPAAALMGVGRSLVDKMCEATGKSPSLIQIVLLGPVFHVALLKELDKHFGLGRAVLAQVQQSLGALGLLVR